MIQSNVNTRKTPRQQRSRATVDAILTATTHILVEAGYEALTTNHVAKVAGVSIGSLYQYFPNKEALISAIVDGHIEMVLETMMRSLGQAQKQDLKTLIRLMLQGLVDAHRINPRLHRVLKEEGPRSPGLSGMRDFENAVLDLVRTALKERAAEIRPIDPELAAFILSYAVEAVIRATVIAEDWEGRADEIVEEMVLLVYRYLQ